MLPKICEILFKIPQKVLIDTDNLNLKLLWKCKRPRIANTTMKKNKAEGLTFQDAFYTSRNQDSLIGKRAI